MKHCVRWKSLSAITKASCLLALLLLCAFESNAEAVKSNILLRPDIPNSRITELTNTLRKISGWRSLRFDESGALVLGDDLQMGGSQTARTLLTSAVSGKNVIVLEDASNRQDVAFCQVSEARWTQEGTGKPPVYVILIDFPDFSRVMGDRPALEAFNVGWGVLHEIDHVVHDSLDASGEGEVGQCEEVVNLMRRECGLAERADYYFTYLPGTSRNDFMTRYVRMAFDQRTSNSKKKRLWVMWDATLVGGLEEPRALAARD